jgi:acyl-CoA synthetase (AMP-forming)/AMP-acid ligase II
VTHPARLQWKDGDRLNEAQRNALMGSGAPFEMTTEAVLGVDLPVFVNRPRNLRDVLAAGATRFGDRPYLVWPERTYTFADVIPEVAAAAKALRDRYGISSGDRVAIASANCAEYAITAWAVTALGAITVALNGWWTGPELADGIELTTPKLIFADEARLTRLNEIDVSPTTPLVAFGGQWWGDTDLAATLPTVSINEDDPYLILFTSGTTGRPKGALISHRSTINFIMSAQLGGAANQLLHGPHDPPAPPCVLSASPMFHVSGMTSQLIMAPTSGMTIVYAPTGRWQEDVHLRLSERHRVTNWSLVPTQLWRIIDHPELGTFDLSSVRSGGGGSAVWPPELLRKAKERLPQISIRLGYGMTETTGQGTMLSPPFIDQHPSSVGEAGPGVSVEVRDPDTGDVLEEGEIGEICIRTAGAFLGYWQNPAATAAVLDSQRWYRTGDFGRIEHGLLFLEGRRHDLIIRGGENIYPAEIENRLVEHPAIADVAVIGIEHPQLGQEVKAVVILAPGATLTLEEVRAWAGQALASYKIPAHVDFVDELPRNAMGKVLKRLIR